MQSASHSYTHPSRRAPWCSLASQRCKHSSCGAAACLERRRLVAGGVVTTACPPPRHTCSRRRHVTRATGVRPCLFRVVVSTMLSPHRQSVLTNACIKPSVNPLTRTPGTIYEPKGQVRLLGLLSESNPPQQVAGLGNRARRAHKWKDISYDCHIRCCPCSVQRKGRSVTWLGRWQDMHQGDQRGMGQLWGRPIEESCWL